MKDTLKILLEQMADAQDREEHGEVVAGEMEEIQYEIDCLYAHCNEEWNKDI